MSIDKPRPTARRLQRLAAVAAIALAGCAATPLTPLPPTHPASVDAPEAPKPSLSDTLDPDAATKKSNALLAAAEAGTLSPPRGSPGGMPHDYGANRKASHESH